MPRRRGLRPRLLAAVVRSTATLAFAAERQVVSQMIFRRTVIHLLALALVCATPRLSSAHQEKFSDVIAREVGKGDGTKVDLGRLVDTPWDRMFVFAPYTSLKSAQKVLPGAWSAADHDGLEMRDDICVLAFFDRSKRVARVTQPRGSGDFAGAVRKGGYARSEAIFEVSRGHLVPVSTG